MSEKKKLRVLVVPSDTSGCSFFRNTKPHVTLEEMYPDEFTVDIDYQPNLDDDNFLRQYDIIQYHRTLGNYETMGQLTQKLEDMGIVSIMDIDDYWELSRSHPAFLLVKEHGLDKKILNNVRVAKNVTTTTTIFAKEIEKYNKNVYVVPNAIDPKEKQYIPNPEPSKRIRIGWLGGSCLTPDTEILTEDGWKSFVDLDQNLKVATLNPETHQVEYHKPDNYIKVPHKGDIYVCDTNSINFSVTGNHNMYVSEKNKKRKELKYKFTQAEKLADKNYYKKDAEYIKEDVEYFILPGVEQGINDIQEYSTDKKILMDDWLKFFGFFIAEGWTSNAKNFEVGICQHKNNTFLLELQQILQNNNFGANITGNGTRIRVCHKQLWTYLHQFGGAKDKHIPRDLLNSLSSRQLGILLEWYLKGDGNEEKTGDYIRRRGYTISKQLADDLMEIAFKMGEAASIKNRGKRTPKVSVKENGKERIIIPRHDAYQIGFYAKTSKRNKLNPLVKAKDITKEYYDGDVYCVEVKNHIIHVRRGGKGMWVGNSHLHDLQNLTGVATKLRSDNLLDKTQLVLCGFDLRGTMTVIDQVTKQQTQRPIKPHESVWYEYEKIFTDNYKIVSPEYKEFLLSFKNEEYPNVENEPYRRVWTKPVSTYATNYNCFDIALAPIEENIFNSVKSSLKITEAAFHNKAIIAQNFGPYKIDTINAIKFGGEIDPNGNCILVDANKNHKDWYKAIKKLILEPELLEMIKTNLHRDITAKYSMSVVTSQRRDLYHKLVSDLKNKNQQKN